MDHQPDETQAVYERLKTILDRYTVYFHTKQSGPNSTFLTTMPNDKLPQEMIFAGIEAKDGGVLYTLKPVEMYETISGPISPQLKKHMRGSSSFFFVTMEEEQLFQEIEALTQLSVDKLHIEGIL